eukprot:2018915-Prymnesium_polylepis.1
MARRAARALFDRYVRLLLFRATHDATRLELFEQRHNGVGRALFDSSRMLYATHAHSGASTKLPWNPPTVCSVASPQRTPNLSYSSDT